MSEIYLDEQAAAATPSTGEVVVYAKADGLLYSKDEAGVETKLSNETGGTTETIYNEGAAPSTPASSTVSVYAKTDGLLYGKDDAGLETKLSNEAVESNAYPLSYKNANYTIDLSADSVILTYQTTDIVITVPLSTTFPNDMKVREFMVMNLSPAGSVTLTMSGAETMSNGLASMACLYKEPVRFAGAYPTLGQGWAKAGLNHRELQVRRNSDWADGNFNNFTGIPWDTEDYNSDTNVFGFSTSTNPSRLIAKSAGQWTLSCFGTFDSTGGGSYQGFIRILKNGTDVISGSEHHTGNYQNEDAMVVIASIIIDMAVDDYLEIQLDHTNLTGDATGFTCSIRTVV